MNLRARWQGALPVANEYLRSQGPRTKFAYRIVAVDIVSKSADDHSLLRMTVERLDVGNIPADAVVHDWKWDPRNRRQAAGWSSR